MICFVSNRSQHYILPTLLALQFMLVSFALLAMLHFWPDIIQWIDYLSNFEQMSVDDVYLSFLPLAHVLDRVVEEYFFHKGASVGYFHGVYSLISLCLSCSILQYDNI